MTCLGRRAFAAVFLIGASALPLESFASPRMSVTRLFFCFFEPGSDALSPNCEQVLTEYVDYWTNTRDGRDSPWPPGAGEPPRMMPVIVNGHADGAEASRGQAIVGERRARAVAEWLIAAGIPREHVSPTGHGASQFLVPTLPNEAERQNRRVEIVSRR